MKYTRVTYEVRCQIDAYLQAGFSKSEIAKIIGFHKSTVSRELQRNFHGQTYNSWNANQLAKDRYKNCRKPYKLKGPLKHQVIKMIKEDLSPEQVAGRITLETNKKLSHECIYQMIRKDKYQFLPYMRRMKKRGCGRYIKRRSAPPCSYFLKISQRPKTVDKRTRLGDWERDTMLMKNRKPILVCVERKTRLVKIGIAANLKADTIEKLTEKLLSKPDLIVRTITNDRGPEFNNGSTIPQVTTYHCDPHRPQQRGTVENTIGLLRKYFRKKMDITEISIEDVSSVENKLNNRPRKILNYLTPNEVYFKKRVALEY